MKKMSTDAKGSIITVLLIALLTGGNFIYVAHAEQRSTALIDAFYSSQNGPSAATTTVKQSSIKEEIEITRG